MSEWSEYHHIYANNSPPGVLGGVSCLRFDPYSELLWVGSASGQVSSHFGADLQRYTSYAAHGTGQGAAGVRALHLDERHVFSAGENGLHASSRKGMTRWDLPIR